MQRKKASNSPLALMVSYNAICPTVLKISQHLGQNVFWLSLWSTHLHTPVVLPVTHHCLTFLLSVPVWGKTPLNFLKNLPTLSSKMHCDIYLDMNILSIWILQSSKYSNFFFLLWQSRTQRAWISGKNTCQTCFKKHNHKHRRILCAHENQDIFN